MSQPQLINILSAFNVRIDGIGLFGDGQDCTLPKVALKMAEMEGGSAAGAVDTPVGLEKLDECGWTMTSYDPRVFGKMGNYHDFVFIGAARSHGVTGAKSIVARMRGYATEADFGDWKSGEKSELKFKISPDRYSLHIDEEEVWFIDMLARKFRRNGVEFFEDERSILGFTA